MTIELTARDMQTIVSPNSFNDFETLKATRTVITFTIADVFDLTPGETLWADYHIRAALEQFHGHKATVIAAPVRHELLTGEYSKRLSQHTDSNVQPTIANSRVARVDVLDWAGTLASVATTMYSSIRPITMTGFIGQIAGILTELGVDNPVSPRASRYLPNTIRHSA